MHLPVSQAHPVIAFDGVCNLCTASVQFVIARDRRRRFRFVSLQSPAAKEILGRDFPEDDPLGSVLLFDGSKLYSRSGAALRIARKLDGLWPALVVFLILPAWLRDAVYDWIGRRRYALFGKRDACWLPTPDISERFLDG